MKTERIATFQDASRLVSVGLFRARASGATRSHLDAAASVPEDMLVVGGGATVSGPGGAVLTASCPDDRLSAWLGTATGDDAAGLTVYALGLRMEVMTLDELRDSIVLEARGSAHGPHPEATARVPLGFVLLGGGFRLETAVAGEFAAASYPSADRSWTARSGGPDAAGRVTVRSYAIGLREQLQVGRVTVAAGTRTSRMFARPDAVARVPNGFALTGGGARTLGRARGGPLWRVEPGKARRRLTLAASAHGSSPVRPARITAYALGIRIV